MGSWCALNVSSLTIDSTKNGVDPLIMTIFQELDKRIYEMKASERYGEDEEEDYFVTVCEYSIPVEIAVQRLNLLGFTLGNTEKDFEIGVENKIKETLPIIESGEKHVAGTKSETSDDFLAHIKKEVNFLSNTSLEDWIKAFQEILDEKNPSSKSFTNNKNPTIKYILEKQSYEDIAQNYPFNADYRYFLRALFEACPKDTLVTYDLTDLIHGGWLSLDTNVCELALNELTGDYPINSKIIVLTEGSTDKFILEESLKLLYPHLMDYYSFMDFGLSNIAGGAGTLVGNVKAFSSTPITNRIIAIFDNDTAAHVAIKGLRRTTIPENIKILHYPKLNFGRNYPTIGPAGISYMDVNGLACSIELYFGKDILIQNGKFVPVQWKGYDETLEQYQGELIAKTDLQKRFYEKLQVCRKDSAQIHKLDWQGIDAILQTIFRAFT